MKKLFLLSISLLLALAGCEDNTEKKPTGDMNVSVWINGNVPVENANVYTNPPTTQGNTDGFGTILLRDLEAGSYEVYANLGSFGSGKNVANIKEGELTEVSINIIEGVNLGLAPVIQIIFPQFPADFSTGEEILFKAVVKDEETIAPDLKVTLESNLDGILFTGSPNAEGDVQFRTSSLSKGIHEITITAEDTDGFISSSIIEVSTLAPGPIELISAEKHNGIVTLEWSQYEDEDFLKYDIFRVIPDEYGNPTFLRTITEANQTTFTDSLPPMVYRTQYYVIVTNKQNKSRTSNTLSVDMPGGHIFNFVPSDMLKHPDEDVVYLVDQGTQKLIKFDYKNNENLAETDLMGNVGYCDIGDNGFGVEIYVPGSDGWIYVYDADDLSLKTTINTGLETTSVVINGLGHVIAAVVPSPWWEQPVRTYDRETGINIDGNGDFDGDRLRMIPGKNEIISITTGISPVDMEYFLLGSNGSIESHHDDSYHGDHPLDPQIFRISNDGSYVVTSSQGAVYTANSTMTYQGQIQRGTLQFSDFAFSDDGTIFYAATSNRKSIQIGEYPSLLRNDEIMTRGYPKFILRSGNQIIALSLPEQEYYGYSGNNSSIEIIDLPQ